tara:strand:- start:401 stop:1051 length:651 start_codon:yes stop_codon:yes gene_type:complete
MYNIIQPFGPMIYHGQCSEEFLKFLNESLDPTRTEAENMSHVLAGNISEQYKLIGTPQTFVDHVYPHVLAYVAACHERHNASVLDPSAGGSGEVVRNVHFTMPVAPWVNYQKQHEFNPIHMHGGELSAVVMVDIPKEIEEFYYESHGTTNMPAAGLLEFVDGKGGYMYSGSHKIVPKTGDFFIFPADLKHGVYPFSVDVERISLSFNISGVEVNVE